MNYQKVYYDLIYKRKHTEAEGYTESHHILPTSLGGTNEPYNLVILTAREHYLAHWLLWKIHRCKKTAYAIHMMSTASSKRHSNRYSKHKSLHMQRFNDLHKDIQYTVTRTQNIALASTKKKLKRNGVAKVVIKLFGILHQSTTVDFSLACLGKILKRKDSSVRNYLNILKEHGLYNITKTGMASYNIEVNSL